MTRPKFIKRSAGPPRPDAVRAAADKLRRFAARLDARATDPVAVRRELRDLTHYARALEARHQERPTMSLAAVRIPDDVLFDDLHLSRDPVTGEVAFDWRPIERICEYSGLDVSIFREASEDNVGALMVAWYQAHRAAGGAADPVQEQILAEVEAEDALGAHRVQIGSGTPQ